jgi:hypothetical protein
MACFATPYELRYAAHCFNRADAQNNRPALILAGGKLGVTSIKSATKKISILNFAQALQRIILLHRLQEQARSRKNMRWIGQTPLSFIAKAPNRYRWFTRCNIVSAVWAPPCADG